MDEASFREEKCLNGPLSLKQFHEFLIIQQDEKVDNNTASNIMLDFLQDASRNVQEPKFTASEFLDYLFSKKNEIWNQNRFGKVYQVSINFFLINSYL